MAMPGIGKKKKVPHIAANSKNSNQQKNSVNSKIITSKEASESKTVKESIMTPKVLKNSENL
jgi:hypothetical protein